MPGTPSRADERVWLTVWVRSEIADLKLELMQVQQVPPPRQKQTEIVVVMSDKYRSDFPHVHHTFREPACDPVPRVHNATDAIDNQ